MSCSKPLPPFVCDSLYYLNRDPLERFSIVCRPLKNFIERYFHSKPYRIFHRLEIRGGSYKLIHKGMQWHPNRDDYSLKQFLARQKIKAAYEYYPYSEMRSYLGPTIRIENTIIYVAGNSTYNREHIEEMESIAYLWRDHKINITKADYLRGRIVAEDFQPILNSPTILQCRELDMISGHFSFKDYKVLYAVKVLCVSNQDDIVLNYWQQFLEQPRVKPVVVFYFSRRQNIDNLLEHLTKAFSSAVSTNAFKIVLVIDSWAKPLTEFRETNKTSREILELMEGLPVEYQNKQLARHYNYTLERSSI